MPFGRLFLLTGFKSAHPPNGGRLWPCLFTVCFKTGSIVWPLPPSGQPPLTLRGVDVAVVDGSGSPSWDLVKGRFTMKLHALLEIQRAQHLLGGVIPLVARISVKGVGQG